MSKKPTAAAKFALGDQVRVRLGVKDPDFPDIPLGGWVGLITEVKKAKRTTYLIRWNQKTLANIHPVYRKRCDRDGLEFEEMWLGEEDLELDTVGDTLPEKPTQIVTRPLSMKDQEDRIRAVLGLTSDDPLPEVDENTLRSYYDYLAANLKFPFAANWTPEQDFGGKSKEATIHSLPDTDDSLWFDESYGILCQAKIDRRNVILPLSELEKVKDKENARIIDDYLFWFWNNR